MKQTLSLLDKRQLALYLSIVFAMSILANYFVQQLVEKADQSVVSLYNDRMIPALDIASLQKRLYENQLLLQEHISAATLLKKAPVTHQIKHNNTQLDSLLNKYMHTVLVVKEVESIKKYRMYLALNRNLQGQIIHLSDKGYKQEATSLYMNEGHIRFKQLMEIVQELSTLQASIGQSLYTQSHQSLLGAESLTYLAIGVTLVIGLLAHVLIKSVVLPAWSAIKPSLN